MLQRSAYDLVAGKHRGEKEGVSVTVASCATVSSLRVIAKALFFLLSLYNMYTRVNRKRPDYLKHCGGGGGGGACDYSNDRKIGILYPQSARVPTPCMPSLEPQPR